MFDQYGFIGFAWEPSDWCHCCWQKLAENQRKRRTSCIAGATLRYGRQGDHQRSSGEPWQESRHLGTGLNPAAHQGLPATKDLQPVHMWPWMHQIFIDILDISCPFMIQCFQFFPQNYDHMSKKEPLEIRVLCCLWLLSRRQTPLKPLQVLWQHWSAEPQTVVGAEAAQSRLGSREACAARLHCRGVVVGS